MRVLIIDDSSVIREQVQKALAPGGFQVLEAEDGVQGLESISAGDLSLVICDVNMPRMDGLEMLDRMKADTRYTTLPVLMLTADGHPSQIARARAAGAKGWLLKPVKPELLLAAVRKLTTAPAPGAGL